MPDDRDDGREPFVVYLETLRRRRGALTALSRASGRDLVNAESAWPYILKWCSKPAKPQLWRDEVYLALATLYARNPRSWVHDGTGLDNMGASLARLRWRSGREEWLDQQVKLLLMDDRAGVCRRLNSLITPLAQWEVPVEYSVLLRDLLAWWGVRPRVALRWARAYYGHAENDGGDAVTEEEVVDAR